VIFAHYGLETGNFSVTLACLLRLLLLGDYAAQLSEIKKPTRYGSETFWESVFSS
jgi:hypothetical protein